MKMKKSPNIVKKVPLRFLIENLISLYNEGVDFIDIAGESKDGENNIEIIVDDDYYCPPEEMDDNNMRKDDLSDDMLNDLI